MESLELFIPSGLQSDALPEWGSRGKKYGMGNGWLWVLVTCKAKA